MFTIGLTGGISTGKSAASQILKDIGALILDADSYGHMAYKRNSKGYDEVVRVFGSDMVGKDGEIDRRVLGSVVFGDRSKLSALTSIVWPEIRAALQNKINTISDQQPNSVIVLEAAVLLDAGWEDLCDETWVVTATEELVLSRLYEKRGIPRHIGRARMRAQMSPAERERRADVMIENNGDVQTLKRTLEKVWGNRVSIKEN